MDKKKIVVALALLPAFVWVVGWGPLWLWALVVTVLAAGVGGWETARLLFGEQDPTLRTLATAMSISACLAASAGDDLYAAIAVVAAALISLTAAGLGSTDLTTAPARAAKLLFVAIYPGLLSGYTVALKSFEPVVGNLKLVILLFALVWINDAGAYFVGSAMGKRPFAPRISPKKTWEGAIGGFAATVLLALLAALFSRLSLAQGLFLGVTLGVAGPLGDLVESALKRGAGVKDSGVFLPGHGGVLDRIDSIIFCAPILYYYVVLSHYASLLSIFGGKS